MADVTLDLIAPIKDATKSVDKFAKETAKSLESVERSFTALKTVALGAVAFLGARELVSGISAVTEAASIQEDAIKQLNTALKLSGDFSEEASQEFQDFASSLQAASTIGDETTLSQLALAKSFGVTNDQAKQLVQAATDLSAATGISLDSAVRNLGKTFGGLTGELGEVVPALKNLTKEQLESGAAIDFVANRFGGAAEALTGTFSGAVTQAQNTFGDLLEELGFFITQNPVIINGIREFSKAAASLIGIVQQNSDGIKEFITDGLIAIVNAVPPIISAFQSIGSVLNGVVKIMSLAVGGASALISTFLEFRLVSSVVAGLADTVAKMAGNVIQLVGIMIDLGASIPGVSTLFNELGIDIDGVSESIDTFGQELTKAGEAGEAGAASVGVISDSLASVQQSAFETANASDEFFNGFNNNAQTAAAFAEDLAKKIGDTSKAAKTASETIAEIAPEVENSFIDKLISFDFAGAGDDLAQGVTSAFDSLGKKAEDAFSGIASTFGFGDEGDDDKPEVKATVDKKDEDSISSAVASGAVSGFSIVGDQLAGGLVNQLSGILNSLGNLPNLLLSAFDNLDQVATNLVKAFPQLVNEFVDAVPEIVDKFVAAVPAIVENLARELPRIIAVLADAFIDIIDIVLKELPKIIDALPEIFEAFLSRLPKLLETILQRLPAIIESVFRALPEIFRSIIDIIPDLVVTLSENIGPIVTALVEGIIVALPDIIFALIDVFILKGGIVKIALAFVQLGPRIGIAIAQGFANALADLGPRLFEQLGVSFSEGITFPEIEVPEEFTNPPFLADLRELLTNPGFIKDLRNALDTPPFLKKLQRILDSFNPSFGGGGGGGGGGGVIGQAVSSAGSAIGLQEGGLVPPGFPNDTFPANLTSGEAVIPRDIVSRLEQFLAEDARGQGQDRRDDVAQNVTVNLVVGEQELANVILNLNRQGFRTA